ncbi:IS3 family transposase [Saccharospirillum mangrovi]|uniref:IS3 family transposase n=1 Tax=Saccharospirillum mangrovi TaxID=2161747 RepID=UPI003B8338BD
MDKPTITRKKRTQRDYNLGFKLAVVEQVEKGELTYKQAQDRYGIQGRSTVLVWLCKHGQRDWTQTRSAAMPPSKETPEQRIKRLEKELDDERTRNLVLNEMITIMDEEHGTELRKKLFSQGARRLQAQGKVSLSRTCALFGCSRQGLYQRVQRHRRRQAELQPVLTLVQDVRRQLPRLGTRKLYHLLQADWERLGIKLGRDGLFDYLRQQRLLIRPKRRYTKTTDSRHWLKRHPNLYNNQRWSRPEQAFVADITYLESREGVHYLSLVTDAFSRRIMGHELSREMKATDTVKALTRALRQRMYAHPLIHHSDRGVQYCSAVYQAVLRRYEVKPSMTDGYDCYQNALAERVNGILKQEFLVERCNTFEELGVLVEQSIRAYNRLRPHLSLGMKTPDEVHKKASCWAQLA